MQLKVWDTVFVRSSRKQVHAVLVDPAGYGRWWPGVKVASADGAKALTLRPPRLGGALRRQRLVWTITEVRPGLGLRFACAGDLVGHGEWYYLDEAAGVVVHYLAVLDTSTRRWRTVLADHRAVMRAGLNALKDRLEAVSSDDVEVG